MLSRRGFLGYAGAGAVAVGCYPGGGTSRLFAASTPTSLESMRKLPGMANLILGYPINMTTPPREFFDWRKQLAEVGVSQFAFNNVGNPFVPSPIPTNTHAMEREVICRFAKLYGFAPKDIWGFLSNSGTDSNMHGMYMGRTILKNRTGEMPKVFFTKEAHYSIQILRDLLGIEWVEVGTNPDGSMNAESLGRCLSDHPNHPALVVPTIGTTFKGAIDSIDAIRVQLKDRESYIHLDAALFGGYLPHTRFADELKALTTADKTGKTHPRYHSLAVSCHKFFGFHSPAGLFVTAKRVYDEFQAAFEKVHSPDYIHQVPGTITCSRDSVKPAEFLFFSSETAFARQAEDAREMLQNAEYLHKELKSRFPDLCATRSNDRSNTIYFRRPSAAILSRYSLASMELTFDGKKERFAHVVVMPHAKKKILDQFLEDLEQDSKK
ncbi:MAG: twin-arginine translocation signal domain-containing protein [Planctomycetia bacterium]|nr:twin-arginine translocation signal domain-containing protein [Planctomycetia bacterium]